MIMSVSGQLELFICSQCDERWLGQSGEPRTQQWLAGHDGAHGQLNMPLMKDVPKGFDRPGILFQ